MTTGRSYFHPEERGLMETTMTSLDQVVWVQWFGGTMKEEEEPQMFSF